MALLSAWLSLEGYLRRDIKFPGTRQEDDSSLPAWQLEKFPAYLEQPKGTIMFADPVAALIFVCI